MNDVPPDREMLMGHETVPQHRPHQATTDCPVREFRWQEASGGDLFRALRGHGCLEGSAL